MNTIKQIQNELEKWNEESPISSKGDKIYRAIYKDDIDDRIIFLFKFNEYKLEYNVNIIGLNYEWYVNTGDETKVHFGDFNSLLKRIKEIFDDEIEIIIHDYKTGILKRYNNL